MRKNDHHVDSTARDPRMAPRSPEQEERLSINLARVLYRSYWATLQVEGDDTPEPEAKVVTMNTINI